MLRIKINNKSNRDIQDITVTCDGYGSSGTRIDKNTQTLYEVIKANQSLTFNDFNMGFIRSQVNGVSCKILDFKMN